MGELLGSKRLGGYIERFPDVSKLFYCKVEIMHNIKLINKLD